MKLAICLPGNSYSGKFLDSFIFFLDFLNNLKSIKNANQFWEVDRGIRQLRADRPDYGFEKLVNGMGQLSRDDEQVVAYLIYSFFSCSGRSCQSKYQRVLGLQHEFFGNVRV